MTQYLHGIPASVCPKSGADWQVPRSQSPHACPSFRVTSTGYFAKREKYPVLTNRVPRPATVLRRLPFWVPVTHTVIDYTNYTIPPSRVSREASLTRWIGGVPLWWRVTRSRGPRLTEPTTPVVRRGDGRWGGAAGRPPTASGTSGGDHSAIRGAVPALGAGPATW